MFRAVGIAVGLACVVSGCGGAQSSDSPRAGVRVMVAGSSADSAGLVTNCASGPSATGSGTDLTFEANSPAFDFTGSLFGIRPPATVSSFFDGSTFGGPGSGKVEVQLNAPLGGLPAGFSLTVISGSVKVTTVDATHVQVDSTVSLGNGNTLVGQFTCALAAVQNVGTVSP